MNCLLCQSSKTVLFKVDNKPTRNYFHCHECDLIFMNPDERLNSDQEKQRYDLHQNQETAGYTSFLAPLIKDIQDYFFMQGRDANQVTALDYGCGPSAFLSELLRKQGYQVENFDPFYFPQTEVLNRSYDLITSTEVWEHFYNPREEIIKQIEILKSGGVLAIMTSAHHGPGAFTNWYYRRDLTHVTFYSPKTMKWISDFFDMNLIKGKTPYWIIDKK